MVENGTITDLGKLSTVKQYLRDIQDLGINPVTISTRMNAPMVKTTMVDDENNEIHLKVLPNLTDVLKAYEQQIAEEQEEDCEIHLTPEELEQIDKL